MGKEIVIDKVITKIVPKETIARIKKIDVMLERYKNYKIENKEQLVVARDDLKQVQLYKKELLDSRMSITKPLDLSRKNTMDIFRPTVEKVEELEASIKQSGIIFNKDEKERVAKEQAKLDEKARQEEEREKKKLEEKAKKAEAKGDEDKAEELRQKKAEVYVPPPVVENTAKNVKGMSFSELHRARVVNFELLPDPYKIANQPMLNKFAVATKGTIPIPGVEFYTIDSASGSTK